jgi:hypothetical protein
MKAKYSHYGNDCIIYDQVICEDNIVATARTYRSSWFDAEPETEAKVFLTNAEARRRFFAACDKLERQNYDCVYKEVNYE